MDERGLTMRRSKDGPRKVWIKRYLKKQLGLSERQMRQFLKDGYHAETTARFILAHGYKPPIDRRTTLHKQMEQAKKPMSISERYRRRLAHAVPKDETLC